MEQNCYLCAKFRPLEDYQSYIQALPSDTEWIVPFVNLVDEALLKGKAVYVIAVARKMARLLEYYIQIDNKLRDCLENKNVQYITEHAIPLVLPFIDSSRSEIIILDDLIVMGDTVDTISEQAYYITGIRPYIIAIGATEKAVRTPRYGNLVFPINHADNTIRNLLEDSLIPAFTARNSWNIIKLKKPIDLEFTILKVKTHLASNVIAEHLEDKLREVFPNDLIYSINHHIPGSDDCSFSVTVTLNRSIRRLPNNDFAKIRFFAGDGELRVVCYAPNIWEEPVIKDLVRYNTPELNRCWDEFIQIIEKTGEKKALVIDDVSESILEQHYLSRRDFTHVVWANYLLSFDVVMILKGCISKITEWVSLGSSEMEICKSDLIWLIGEDLSNKIQPLLNEVLRHDATSCHVWYELTSEERNLIPSSIIPMEGRTQYEETVQKDCYLSGNIPVALSLIYYRLWSMFGLIDNRKREDRVQVGESFDSLQYKISRSFNNIAPEDIKCEIHKWIDTRIDLGIVVPKYEASLPRLGYKVWRRYFRAGEREDRILDAARFFAVFSKRIELEGSVTIDDFIKNWIGAFNQCNEETGCQMTLDDFSNGFLRTGLDGTWCSNLWVYLVLCGVFTLVDKQSWDTVTIDTSKDYDVLSKATALFNI